MFLSFCRTGEIVSKVSFCLQGAGYMATFSPDAVRFQSVQQAEILLRLHGELQPGFSTGFPIVVFFLFVEYTITAPAQPYVSARTEIYPRYSKLNIASSASFKNEWFANSTTPGQ